jgi:hypothetical protein
MAKIFKTNQNLVNAGFNQVSGETLTLSGNTLIANSATFKYTTDQHSRYTARSIVDAAFVTGFTSGGTGGGDKNNIYSITGITGSTILTLNDYIILVNSTITGITITLPNSPIEGQAYKIKDVGGFALTNNVIIDGNGNTIDGASIALINTDYGAVELVFSMFMGSGMWYSLAFIN